MTRTLHCLRVNEEHARILKLCADFEFALANKAPTHELAELLNNLIETVEQQFNTEESLLADALSHHLFEHKKMHEAYLDQLVSFIAPKTNVSYIDYASFDTDLLSKWWKKHIDGERLEREEICA